jgi:hypothetical protein
MFIKMGYLICDECGGYYELQEGESPEDFSDTCECGGKLIYQENMDVNHHKDAPEVQKDLKYYLFYKLDPKLELKLWGLIIMAFAIAELVFAYFAVSVDGPIFIIIMSLAIAIIALILGIVSFRNAHKNIYWAYAAVALLLFFQDWMMLDITHSSKLVTLVFVFLMVSFVAKALEDKIRELINLGN